MKATLLLEDGTRIEGTAAGSPGVAVGTLSVFCGHDAIYRVTDPSSAGQICAFTQPTVGSWGVNTEHCETGVPWVRGLVAREIADVPGNWRSAENLDFYLRRNLITAVTGIDVQELRKDAVRKNIKRCAIVSSEGFSGWDTLLSQVKSYRYDNTFSAAVKSPVTYGSGKSVFAHAAVCDFGSSRGLTRLLNSVRVRVTLIPPYDAPQILERGGYDALILPNGAGSPRSHPGITEGLRDLIAAGVPMLGFGLGFQFLAAALGIRPQSMREPHRGAWFPVTDVETGSVLYTWQNHDQTIGKELPPGVRATHINAADGTVEGFTAEKKPLYAAHFLPCTDIRLGGTGEMLSAFFSIMRGFGGDE